MKRVTGAAFAVLTLAAGGTARAASVEIRDAVARVVVIPEARSDVQVTISGGQASKLPALTVERTGSGKVIVDGDLKRKIGGCRQSGIVLDGEVNPTRPPENLRIEVRGVGDVRLADAPLVTVRVPRVAKVSAGGAVFGAVDRSDSLELSSAGCGDWTVANTGDLTISVAGSGDVAAGAAAKLKVSIAGSGDVRLVSARDATISIAGSGDVRIGRLDGDLNANLAGSGDVRIASGRVGALKAAIAGAGDVVVAGPVQSVDASVIGSGDVRVASAGSIKKSVMGSGSVIVGQ